MIDLQHPMAVLATRLPRAVIEAPVAPKLARQARPAKQASGDDLAGQYSGFFGGGVSPAGRPRLPIQRHVHIHGGTFSHDQTAAHRCWSCHSNLPGCDG